MEFSSARTVADDAGSRLGELVGSNPAEGALAVRAPNDLAQRQTGLGAAIGRARFDRCLFTVAGALAANCVP